MTSHEIVVIIGMVCLTVANIAAWRYLEIFGLFVTAGSVPIVMKLLEVLK